MSVYPANDERVAREIEALDRLSFWLDSRFRLPGTQFRFGLDSLIGLVPGIGDIATLAPSAYLVWRAARLGVPRGILLRMFGNMAADSILGAVPLLGDVFDAAFKANRRNINLLKGALQQQSASHCGPLHR